MTDVRMGRGPLPQPPGYMAEQHEIAWYEHEERMRPSYVLQPTQHLYAQPQPQRRQPQPQQPPYQQGYTAYTPKQPPLSSSARWGAAAGAPQAPDRPGAEQATRQQHRSSFPATPSPVGRSLQHQTAASQSDAGTATGVAGTTMTQASWERCGSVSSTPVGVTGAFPSRPGAVHMYSTPSRLRTPHALEYDNSDMRRATKGSAFMHKGFFDILNLANSPTGRPSPNVFKTTLSKATGRLRKNSNAPAMADDPFFSRPSPQLAVPMQSAGEIKPPLPPTIMPRREEPSASAAGMLVAGPRAQKKRISTQMIGAPRPESFYHAAHASDAEQAEEILRRWGIDGIGKVADPVWTDRCKKALRVQAARNQAEAVAQVQAALHMESLVLDKPRQYFVANGQASPSTLTATTSATDAAMSSLAAVGHGTSHDTLLTLRPSPPSPSAAGPYEEQKPQSPASPSSTQRASNATASPPRASRPPLMPRTNTQGTTFVAQSPDVGGKAEDAPDYLQYQPVAGNKRASKVIDGLPGMAGGANSGAFGAFVSRPQSMLVNDDDLVDATRNLVGEPMAEPIAQRAGAALRPSLTTVEKSVAAKIYFENLYYGILKKPQARETRRAGLEAELLALRIPESSKDDIRAAWVANETTYLRDVRARVSANSFTRLKTIGHGAFGVVALVRERSSGAVFAMKQLRKADMLRKGQEGHVRAERDLMTSASASTNAQWIVKLVYSFQDVDHLYLIMEFMGGGDLLNLLIEKDVFAEDFARFYVAEMILAIHEAHKLGYIHRDIKPDNFLFSSEGHVKLADFGLCQSFHWAHDGAYYEQQRKHLLKKHGIDLDDAAASGRAAAARGAASASKPVGGASLTSKELENVMSDRNKDGTPLTHVLTWREKNKKRLAYSVVGTNNYMAPEVLRGLGYDQSCDWWSLGVIVFEMLYGYPPFVSKSRHMTRQKIINWKQTLRFPSKPKVSREAQDLITRLVCEKEDRLGSLSTASVSRPNSLLQGSRQRSGFNAANSEPGRTAAGGLADGVEDLMAHPWFRGIDWTTLHSSKAPFVPALSHAADTKHFEDDIGDEPLPAPGAAEAAKNGLPPPVDQPRDPMLRDKAHGQHLLEMRKQLAFVGYTFKSPKAFNPRTQLTESKFLPKDNGSEKQGADDTGSAARLSPPPIQSRLRSMSM